MTYSEKRILRHDFRRGTPEVTDPEIDPYSGERRILPLEAADAVVISAVLMGEEEVAAVVHAPDPGRHQRYSLEEIVAEIAAVVSCRSLSMLTNDRR